MRNGDKQKEEVIIALIQINTITHIAKSHIIHVKEQTYIFRLSLQFDILTYNGHKACAETYSNIKRSRFKMKSNS